MRAILTWHSLDSSGSPISVPPDEFRRQVEWLAHSKIPVVTIERLLELSDETDAAALSFDDGFANFSREALPVLAAHGFPCTMFVVTGHIGKDNRWGGREEPGIPVLPLLDWEELGRLREQGVSLAAHTATHPHLPGCDAPRLAAEVVRSADVLASTLGRVPDGFAYPYGEVSADVERVVAATYRWACTTEFRALECHDAPHRLPRLDAWYLRAPARRAGWGSRRFRTWIWSRRQGRRARSWLRGAVRR